VYAFDSRLALSPLRGGTTAAWSANGVKALVDLIAMAPLSELNLGHNGLCGLAPAVICGERSTTGLYTTGAVDMLLRLLEREKLSLTSKGVKLDGNSMRDDHRASIMQALKENPSRPMRNPVHSGDASVIASRGGRRGSVGG
jgi:hypothetical protein